MNAGIVFTTIYLTVVVANAVVIIGYIWTR